SWLLTLSLHDALPISSLVIVIKMIQRHFRQERLNALLKEEKISSELQILKNQLQPHFLLNTLNNIYGLVLDGDKKAAGTLIQLRSEEHTSELQSRENL